MHRHSYVPPPRPRTLIARPLATTYLSSHWLDWSFAYWSSDS